MEGGGDTNNKKSTLPPPPILSNNNNTMKPPTVSGNSSTSASGLSSLPPPPTLANGVVSGNVTSSSSKVSSKLPPPPTISSLSPQQLTTNPSGESNISTTSSSSQPKASGNIHTVTENIPTLSSAPNSTQFTIPPQNQQSSYIDMHSVYPTAAHNMKTATQQQQQNSTAHSQNNSVTQQSAAQQHFAQQQTSQSNNEPQPTSGNSWTAWAPSGTSALLEKAGQFAYTAAESAADLIVESATNSGGENNIGREPTTPGNIRGENVASEALNMVDASPGVDTSVQQGNATQEVSGISKTDNFANLFANPPPQEGQMPTAASSSIHEEEESSRKEDDDILLKGEMSTPDNSSHPVPQPFQQSQQPQPNQPQQTRRFRAVSNPPTSILAPRQKHLPVLILPTSDAREIATRNNTTLSELFTTYGNLRSSKTTDISKVDKTLEPMLPPLRSANRSMALSWNDIILDFKLVEELDCLPVKESVMESGLDVSVRLWDEDMTTASGEGSEGKGEGRDREMDQLEEYVVNAIKEDEIDECIRKKDGIPSMSSELPSSLRNSNTNQNEEEEEHQRGREPFPPGPEVQLQKASNTAFNTLTTNATKTPYLKRFRHTLDYATNGMSHEMLTNPSVVILVASTSDYSYVNCLAELANVHHLPRPYHDGRYDPNGIRREFLLLHDVQSGPKDFNESAALVTMRERFGVGCCSILKINSLVPRQVAISDGVQNVGEDVEWENNGMKSPFVKDVLSSDYTTTLSGDVDGCDATIIRGACLSPSDKRAIRRYVANMVATGLIPAVERRIAHLNATVTNAKKGVKNVIKSFWRKPKDNNILVNVSGYNDGENNQTSGDVGDQGGGAASSAALSSSTNSVKYRYDSIESQTRLLADTLFLMRDYEAALSSYRLVKDDYKHDKAHLHYASVQEMMVFCMFCLDPSGRDGRYAHDVHHSIETSLYSYTRASDEEKESDASSGITRPGKAPYATRLATRLCLAISASRSLCEGKHMEIADLLASASSHETPLGAAILLEQSSAQYYRAGMLRKYAFHMLMAGHMFRSASQERHAFRCFAASLYVYHGERWGELRSHLRSALAAQLYGMSRYALSMQFYAKLIGMLGGRVSVRSQQKFLNHIVNICKEHPSSALVAIDRMEQGDIDGEQSSRCVDDVLKSSSGDAVRQIELSNIGFPAVQDSSIGIRVSSAGNSCVTLGHSDSLASDDGSGQGTESVWQDMMICAEAEVSSSISSTIDTTNNNISGDNPSSHDDNGPTVPLAHSGDALIDKVISSIDKEERDAEYRDRQKRKGGVRTAEVRATSEPLSVTFSLKNPLGLDIELKEMQLVASLSCPKSGMTHSNEFPVSPKDEAGKSKTSKGWTFHGSSHQFHNPEFMCQQSNDSNTPSSEPVDEEPYFVVTKPSMKMGPNSTTLVNLKICPLAEGDLRILGARFHLLGEVWVYHEFDTPGPLLQDTRDNKSKRARGESLLLRSKVEREMPSLKVTITPDETSQTTVLQGQTSRWKLKVSNVGYAPASNIMLKTNAPWLNMTQSNESSTDEIDPTSYCVGPSGTLMRVPLLNTTKTNVLQPGETVEIPVAIRTSGGGRQDFYMLFRYELWNNEESNLAPRHRWARKLLSVPVYPSITMSASMMPSYSNKGEHILSVELMNYRSDRDSKLEINLNKICIASRHFEIKQLLGQIDSQDVSQAQTGNNEVSSSLKIGWQERVTLHYLVVPIESSSASVIFSTLSFAMDNKNVKPKPQLSDSAHVADFMCRERAHDVFSSTLKAHRVEKERLLAEQEKTGQPRHVAQIRREKTSLPEQESNIGSSDPVVAACHPTSLASLCPPKGGSNINIICCWSAEISNSKRNDDIIYGQHHLRNLLVRPLNKTKGCPLALTAKYEPKVQHNFDEGPLDEEIVITIRNRLIEMDVEFEFTVTDQPGLDFVGTTSFNWSLSGGSEISVPLKARMYAGGVYNLQSVRLTVLKEGTHTAYLFPLQWRCVAEDSA